MEPGLLGDFKQIFEERIAEAQIFLSPERERIAHQQIESAARRIIFIRKEAHDRKLETIAEICEDIVSYMVPVDNLSSHAAQCLQDVFVCIQACLDMEIMQGEGRQVPAGFRQFFMDYSRKLLQVASDHQKLHGKEMRILLADDEEVVRTFLEELLSEDGNYVLAVENGQEAVAALDTGFFDLMFTDINMPFASGIEVLKHASQSGVDTDIVIITGYASVENAAEAIRYGAYDYITKPFQDSEELLATVERAREHISLKRRNQRLMQEMQLKNRELKRYAQGLEEALTNIEEKNRALIHADRMATLGVLVAGLAHEINNPTTFIRGNLQTLGKFWAIAEPFLQEELKRDENGSKLDFVLRETPILIHDMMVGTDRITRITSGLRSFARADAAEDMHLCKADNFIGHALSLVDNRLKHGIDLQKDIRPLPQIICSEPQITQVLVNLLVNAADAVENTNEPCVRIEAREVDEGVLLRVMDNGRGIPESIRQKIFDPFFTTKPVDRGTGLGLSISLGIIHSHGGSLTLAEPGEGWSTVFDMFLPGTSGTGQRNKLPRILVADNGNSILRAMESALRSAGAYEVRVVQSGADLVETTRGSFSPDVVVFDTELPDIDGFELVEKLSCIVEKSHTKIIAVTSINVAEGRQRLQMLGADRVLLKPCRLHDLMENIAEFAGHR